MKCSVCGSELPENSKFCIFCGSTVKAAAPEAPQQPVYTPPVQPQAPSYNPPSYDSQNSLYQQPAYQASSYVPPVYTQPTYTPPPAPPAAPAYTPPTYTGEEVVVPAKPVKKGKKAKKGKKGLVALGIIAAVLAVIIAAGLVVLNIPSVKVPLALSRSINAYAGIAEDIGIANVLASISEDKACDASLALTYKGVNEMFLMAVPEEVDLTQLEGLGVRFTESFSLSDRRFSGTLAAIYKGEDLVTANIGIDDETLWLSLPQLLGDKYGLDTTKLGQFILERDPYRDESVASFGFNVFDLAELMLKMEPSEDLKKDFADATKDLYKAMEIEADGSDEIKVNGKRVTCSVYNVTIDQGDLEDYLDAIEKPLDKYLEKQVLDVVIDMMESIGVPEDIIAEAREEGFEGGVSDMIDSLKDALDYIGDLEFVLYIKGGYVMAAVYELEIDGESMTLTLNMGGKDKYVNDFSMTVEMEDYFTFELKSSGNRSGKEITDKTTLELEADGENLRLTSEMRYKPKEDSDNFTYEVSLDGSVMEMVMDEAGMGMDMAMGFGLEAEGQLTVEDASFRLALDELTVKGMGMDIVTLGLEYSIGAYTGAQSAGNVKYINELTEDDLNAMAAELEANAMTFVEELMEKVPLLQVILNAQVSPPVEVYPSDSYYG